MTVNYGTKPMFRKKQEEIMLKRTCENIKHIFDEAGLPTQKYKYASNNRSPQGCQSPIAIIVFLLQQKCNNPNATL